MDSASGQVVTRLDHQPVPEAVAALIVEEASAPDSGADADRARDLGEPRLRRDPEERPLEDPVVVAGDARGRAERERLRDVAVEPLEGPGADEVRRSGGSPSPPRVDLEPRLEERECEPRPLAIREVAERLLEAAPPPRTRRAVVSSATNCPAIGWNTPPARPAQPVAAPRPVRHRYALPARRRGIAKTAGSRDRVRRTHSRQRSRFATAGRNERTAERRAQARRRTARARHRRSGIGIAEPAERAECNEPNGREALLASDPSSANRSAAVV